MAIAREDHGRTFWSRNSLSLSIHGQSRGAGKDRRQGPVPTVAFLKGWTPELGPWLIWTVLLFRRKVWHLSSHLLPGERVRAEPGGGLSG